MDSVEDVLCSIFQNGWAIEFCGGLSVEEFLQYRHFSIWTDQKLIEHFWSGLDSHIAPWMPVGDSYFSLESYLDMVLVMCGSPFTVGEVL